MTNTLNLIAIICILTFVNSTKTVTYSDVVTNLVQITQDANDRLTQIKAISDSFKISNDNLKNLDSELKENCASLKKRGENTVREIREKIISYQKNADDLTAQNVFLEKENLALQVTIKEEMKKVPSNKERIEMLKLEFNQSVNQVDENINVLKRLKAISEDELYGAEKRATEMTKFNVINKTSFLQSEDFENQLKPLLEKSDPITRSLVSSLIMMTQQAGKQNFVDPTAIKNIVAFIDKIILKSKEKKGVLTRELIENVKTYQNLINNAFSSVANLRENLASKVQTKEVNVKNILFLNNDITFVQRSLNRKVKRNNFNDELCKKQMDLLDRHRQGYEETVSFINKLKDETS